MFVLTVAAMFFSLTCGCRSNRLQTNYLWRYHAGRLKPY